MFVEKLQDDLRNAMRSQDKVRLRTIRSLRAALQQRAIELRGEGKLAADRQDLTDEESLSVLQKQAKQRRDSIEQYEAADREDLASREREELDIIETYLPAQLSEEEIMQEVRVIVDQTGAEGMKDMGTVMGAAMKKLKGRVDGNLVQQAARSILSGS